MPRLYEYPSCHRSAVLINDTGYRGLRLSAHPRLLSHHTYGVLFTSNHEMISQYAKHLPLYDANHLSLQADEIDATGIGLHREAVLSGHALSIVQ